MPSWFLEPRDPLIVRDGRPFGPDPGARARSLSFPMPSTTTGGLRNRAGLNAQGVFDRGKIDTVLQIGVRGPLLAMLADDGTFAEWLAPAPADALWLQPKKDSHKVSADPSRMQLLPIRTDPDRESVSPTDPNLALIGPRVAVQEKPLEQPPRFWKWHAFEAWLTTPTDGVHQPGTIGIAGPTTESRMHVRVNPETQTAEDDLLFQTSGLEFTDKTGKRLALVIDSAEPLEQFKQGGFAPLGGERRLVAWRPGAPNLPTCPDPIRRRIVQERACRIVLLTPGVFTAGYIPSWLLQQHGGVTAKLQAALVTRPLVISGWDMRADNGPGKPTGKPKPTRRLAPAGSVYFVTLPDADTASVDAVNQWIDAIWIQNISDEGQDRLDGFGLAVLGTWDGHLIDMEV